MAVDIRDGWLHGSLPDHTGREWPIQRFPQDSRGPLQGFPDLCLHTTETDGYINQLRFPSQWQCGEGIIGQHIKLGLQGDASIDQDAFLQQIEMVGRSRLSKWLPAMPTLGPTVALVAWLHETGHIRSGLTRPNPDWPVVLDRGPQAVTTYYRRTDGTWRKPGVYGHVELPHNHHWDPGSFDYPAFFALVRKVLAGEDDDLTTDEYLEGRTAAKAKAQQADGSLDDPGVVPNPDWPKHKKAGWNDVRWEVNRLRGRDGSDGTDGADGRDGRDAVLAPGARLIVEGT